MKKILLLIVLASIASPLVGLAGDQSNGCGVGWMFFKKNSLISSYSRMLTGLTFPNTFSMTSGTSGCAAHSIVKNDREPIYFAESNLPLLITDAARGSGEFLTSFAQTFGCEKAANVEFSRSLKMNMSNISTESADQFVDFVNDTIRSNATLSAQCHIRGV